MRRTPAELRMFLVRHDDMIQSLALRLRSIVLDELVPCHEYIFEMRSKVVLLYSVTNRVIADGVCHIAVNRRHLTLVFANGADLDDPGQLLRGKGAIMRHIKVGSSTDLTRPELRAFLRQARAGATRDAGEGQIRRGVVTRVKKRGLSHSPSR